MKLKFNNIIKNYLHSLNLSEHLCIIVAFLEFVLFLSPRDSPLAIHIFLLLFFPLLVREKSKNPRISKKVLIFYGIIILGNLLNIFSYFSNIVIYMGKTLPIIVAIIFIIGGIISLHNRKDEKANLKSLIIIGTFSILFLSNILYNNQYYISNPQLRNHLHSKTGSSRAEEELVLDITSIDIGDFSKITNLKDIEKFKNIKEIYIKGHARNIDGLFELEKLDYIAFYFSDSNILYSINKFRNLKSLKLEFFPSIKEDFILSDMPNLQKLYISGGDIVFLGKLNNLELLDLAFMDLENVDTIKNLKSLKILELYEMNINNIDGILLNDSIEEIHYRNSNIEDYEESLRDKGIKLVFKM
ncbi:hypothetical protein [Oceanirhabdus seepicola]|uniref:Leucine-rich repeat domain-containing protein n=1 Tax=Oceanirhabdus seepicola TaxID=2828781 RepID=A0A9J6NYH3_9CLOT|nr:hypothetical protein [Oceanirhabdus seepicola]MCM1989575.1 hypothetical protein [Oceanirhabdus seepicola]